MANATHGHDSLEERLDFIGMDQKTRAGLSKLQPLLKQAIGPALEVFYDKVKATPATRKFFGDDKHMADAKNAQERHWANIAAADYDDTYVNAVLKIGETHARIGVEPRWYIGGYALVVEQLIHAIVKEQWPHLLQISKGRPEGVAEALSCLVKAAMLDMDFSISVYLETLNRQRQAAEDAGREAIRQERAIVADSIGVSLAKLATKDLTFRMSADIPDVYRQLQTDFNAAIGQLETAMQSVIGTTNAIHAGTQEISTAADDLSRRTEQQAASLEETAAALEQITATVKKSAEGAAHARRLVAAADDDAKKSSAVVNQTVEAMDAIAKSARQINQIIGVIDEIAFQTNLLALNAGVEAARAGDAGRGFAVVASEVRALAQRSAEAAKEIKGLISTSTTEVERGVTLVAETGKSIERMMVQVTDINTIVTEIASGAHEQATGLAEVNTAINQMDQVTQKNAAMVEQSTAASLALTHETEQLLGLIGQFQVGLSNNNDSLRRELQKAAPHAFAQHKTMAASGARGEIRKPVAPLRGTHKAV